MSTQDPPRASLDAFLQTHTPPEERPEQGLQAMLRALFPVSGPAGATSFEFVSYALEAPRYDVETCLRFGFSYAAPLRLTTRLITFDEPDASGARTIRDIKEQELYAGEMPLLTPWGHFMMEGEPRAIPLSWGQGPGLSPASFVIDGEEARGAIVHSDVSTRLSIAHRADGEYVVRIEDDAWQAASHLLAALGDHAEDDALLLSLDGGGASLDLPASFAAGRTLGRDAVDASGRLIAKAGAALRPALLKSLRTAGLLGVPLAVAELAALRSAEERYSASVQISPGQPITPALIEALRADGISSIAVYADWASRAEEGARAFFRARHSSKAIPSGGALEWLTPRALYLGDQAGRLLALSLANGDEARADELTAPYLTIRTAHALLAQLHTGEALPVPPAALHGPGEWLARVVYPGLVECVEKLRARLAVVIEPECLMPHDLFSAEPLGRALRRSLDALPRAADAHPLATLAHAQRFAPGPWPAPSETPEVPAPVSAALCPAAALDPADNTDRTMQHLARLIPIAQAEPPLIATGEEARVAQRTGAAWFAERPGEVLWVNEDALFLWNEGEPPSLTQHPRTSQRPWASAGFSPAVQEGERVAAGQQLAYSACAPAGQLAYGRNVRVQFVDHLAPGQLIASTALAHRLAAAVPFRLSCWRYFDAAEDAPLVPATHSPRGLAPVGAHLGPGDALAYDFAPSQGEPLQHQLPREPGRYHILAVQADGLFWSEHTRAALDAAHQHRQQHIQTLSVKLHAWLRRRAIAHFANTRAARTLVDNQGKRLLAQGAPLDADTLAALPDTLLYELACEDEPRNEDWQALCARCEEALHGDTSSPMDPSLPYRDLAAPKSQDRRHSSPNERVTFTILREQPLSPGDWVADRHGNRGAISALHEPHELPALWDGAPAELLAPRAWLSPGVAREAALGRIGRPQVCPPEEVAASPAPEAGVLYLFRTVPE